MALEIERKFLLKNDSWKEDYSGTIYRQGYIGGQKGVTVRVRIAGDHGFLTIKGPTEGIGRLEFEYQIPTRDADEMLSKLCQESIIEKTRYKIGFAQKTWEIDIFHGVNQGLILAEIELDHEDQQFEKPPWLGQEVTGDKRYFNSYLARHPYSTW